MANLPEGGKRANAFLRTEGFKPEFHDGASLANIISGFHPSRHYDACFKETKNYLHRSAGFKLSDEKVSELIWITHAGL
jgi:hypothetical protein